MKKNILFTTKKKKIKKNIKKESQAISVNTEKKKIMMRNKIIK